MNIILITQNEPFYLSKNLKYLFKILPKNITVVACVLSEVSPFGKKESFINKALNTLNIFGFKFFIYYSLKFVLSKLNNNSINSLLKEYDIPIIRFKKSINSPTSLITIKKFRPDLLVSILGNEIFKSELIKIAKYGCINLHTALLPKYRGLMPTFWVLLNNEKYTGVSVFFVDEGIDSGPIILQKKIKIDSKSQKELITETKKVGMEAIAEAIKLISEKKYSLIPNPENKKTYYSFPKRDDVKKFLQSGKKFY